MNIIKTPQGNFGPYQDIEIFEDRILCDGASLYFSVIGDEYVIEEWDGVRPQPDLEPLKLAKTAEINAIRNAREESGFPFLDKILDSDPRSVQRISVAVQAAQFALSTNQPFAVDWTCADNTRLMLSAEQMIAVPAALASYGNDLNQFANSLKDIIRNATTAEEISVVNISDNWP